MKDWKSRLRDTLEPILTKQDPRPDISAYKDMPLCIFLYDPAAEFELRQELSLLKTRLEQRGKRIIRVSLMDCMMEALANAGVSPEALVENEVMLGHNGHQTVAQTIHQVLSEYSPLDQLVLSKVPDNADPHRDILWITRAGALYPCYRTSTLDRAFSGEAGDPRCVVLPRRDHSSSRAEFHGRA